MVNTNVVTDLTSHK